MQVPPPPPTKTLDAFALGVFFNVQSNQALFINTFIIDKNAGNNYSIIIIGKKAVISKITGQNTKPKTIIMEQL